MFWFFLTVDDTAIQIAHWFEVDEHLNNAHDDAFVPTFIDEGVGEPPESKLMQIAQAPCIFVIPTARILLTQVVLPHAVDKNVFAKDGQILAYALEERLAGDPEDVIVHVLHQSAPQKPKNVFEVVVINRPVVELIQQLAKRLKLRRLTVTADCFLLPFNDSQTHEDSHFTNGVTPWSLWLSKHTSLLRTGRYQAMALKVGHEELLTKRRIAEAMKRNEAPDTICVYGQSEDLMPVESWKVGSALDMILMKPESMINASRVIAILPQRGDWLSQWMNINILRHTTASLRHYIPALGMISMVMLMAFVILWGKMAWEAHSLKQTIDRHFYAIFGPESVKTLTPVVQMEQKYRQVFKNGGAGHEANADFMTILAQVAKAQGNPSNPKEALEALSKTLPQSVSFTQGLLTLEFADAQSANAFGKNVQINGPSLGINKTVTMDGHKVIISPKATQNR